MTRTKLVVCGLIVVSCLAGNLLADASTMKSETNKNWLTLADASPTKGNVESERIDTDKMTGVVPETGWKKPIPITFTIDYTLVTDYIWRGINLSEPRRREGATRNEGREKLNHQLTTGAELDLGAFGRVGGSIWFEWYAGQTMLTPGDSGKHLQEIDYTVYYGYNIEPIGTDVEVGFIWYEFPRARGDADSTQEIYLNLAFDDSVLWRALGFDVKEAIFNPYIFQAVDIDLGGCGYYGEFGLSHDFAIGDFCQAPIIKSVTVTPSWSIGWEHNWLNKFSIDPTNLNSNEGRGRASNGTRLTNTTFGLNVSLDLKDVLGIPDQYCGDFYLNGFLNYSQAIANHFMNDEFWGGMSVGYSW